jgi:hypothetical protein
VPILAKNAPARQAAADKASLGFTFSPQTPREFASIILKQARITNLVQLNKVFAGDPGKPADVELRKDRNGYEFIDKQLARCAQVRNGWFILERPPGSIQDEAPRMRVFNTFEGAAAEFAVKLKLHEEGSLTVGKVPTLTPGEEATRFTFETPSRTMVMAPVATPLVGLLL